MKIAVLGCGPAGLLVAHAGHTMGHEVHIYSRVEKSNLGGAQYLHHAIPGITSANPEFTIDYLKYGERSQYALKAYGNAQAECSWDLWDGEHPAWSLRDAYEKLWATYEELIKPARYINGTFTAQAVETHDLVFNSIPRKAICYEQYHFFESNPAWLVPLAPAQAGESYLPDNTIIYDGIPEHAWHRCSKIKGEAWLEFGVPRPGGLRISKPQRTDCNCWGSRVIAVGRHGLWKRDVLSHSAYLTAVEWLA